MCWQLFSSGLPQQGEDRSSGLWGFVEADILKEARRAHRLVMCLVFVVLLWHLVTGTIQFTHT